jgi:hypothetical protein
MWLLIPLSANATRNKKTKNCVLNFVFYSPNNSLSDMVVTSVGTGVGFGDGLGVGPAELRHELSK